MPLREFRVYFTYSTFNDKRVGEEKDRYFSDCILCMGYTRHEAEIDAKEIISGRGITNYTIDRVEELR